LISKLIKLKVWNYHNFFIYFFFFLNKISIISTKIKNLEFLCQLNKFTINLVITIIYTYIYIEGIVRNWKIMIILQTFVNLNCVIVYFVASMTITKVYSNNNLKVILSKSQLSINWNIHWQFLGCKQLVEKRKTSFFRTWSWFIIEIHCINSKFLPAI
jgi:hypothetical protein